MRKFGNGNKFKSIRNELENSWVAPVENDRKELINLYSISKNCFKPTVKKFWIQSPLFPAKFSRTDDDVMMHVVYLRYDLLIIISPKTA